MQPIARMCRSVWWAFAVAGALALVAAAAVGTGLASPPFATGAWQLASGAILAGAILLGPGLRASIPFVGLAPAGIVLGLAGILLPEGDARIALIAIGIWCVVAGAGYLAVARFAGVYGVPDGGLRQTAWLAIAVGAITSTLPAFGLGGAKAAPVAALAATGLVTILAAIRLRVVPEAPPPVLSKREARRRERVGREG